MQEEIIESIQSVGFDCAIAVATDAEIASNSACGMMSAVIEDEQ